MKVAQEVPGWRGYALMGTHMTVEHVLEVNSVNRNWCLCRDRDATLKAIKYKQQYRHLSDFRVCPIPRDLKYLNRSQIEELIS